MNAFEWQAGVIERQARMLAYQLEVMPADKATWKPTMEASKNTRSVVEQVQECIGLNRNAAARFRGETPPARPDGDPPTISADEAQKQLLESSRDLAAAVRGLDDSALTTIHDLGFGKFTGAFLMEIAASNMSYHAGQAAQIQLLYGDTDFHFPPDTFG